MKTIVMRLPYGQLLTIPDSVDPGSLKAILDGSAIYDVKSNYEGNNVVESYKEMTEVKITLEMLEIVQEEVTLEVNDILAENNRLTRELETLKASLIKPSKEIANV